MENLGHHEWMGLIDVFPFFSFTRQRRWHGSLIRILVTIFNHRGIVIKNVNVWTLVNQSLLLICILSDVIQFMIVIINIVFSIISFWFSSLSSQRWQQLVIAVNFRHIIKWFNCLWKFLNMHHKIKYVRRILMKDNDNDSSLL